jgi:hypothetical protein
MNPVNKFLADKRTFSRKNHGINAHLKPRCYFYASEDVEQWLNEYASQQNAELNRKITRIIESYERELKAWENMETNDLNRGFADGNKRAINAMLIDLKTIKH